MGSPIAPILANLFIGFPDENWIKDSLVNKVVLYKRYVDDIFAAFETKHDAEFFNYLNIKHSNIKFTIAKEQNKQIAFLNILINKTTGFNTSAYHKKTYAGLLMNCFSFVSHIFKNSLIKILIIDTDIKTLQNTLEKNQYPPFFINDEIKRYRNQEINDNTNTDRTNDLNIRYF